MRQAQMIPRHVETLFCDDIRHEMGEKLSYMGVYSGGLFVPRFPVTLPKLCLSVRILTPVDEPLRSLELRVLKNKELMQEITVNEEQLAEASESTNDLAGRQKKEKRLLQVAQFLLVFSPIQFEEPCTLRVRVKTENGEMAGMGLKVDIGESPPDEMREKT